MAEQLVQRRLAAILAADVVGYSRLMEVDEQLTRSRLRSLHHELIDPRIAADGGRTVKSMGDGILVEFPSVVDAVRCALSIQKFIGLRNLCTPDETRIELRIGVNIGDVIIEEDDIHGDGVNVAARLEGLCEPGAVYVSGAAFDQAEGKLEATFEDLGGQTVKNIARPIRVYRAVDKTKADTGSNLGQMDVSAFSDKPSIAVLPFDNLSNDPEQEYFSDGMAEDLITDISKISGVSVAARNSSFAFKGQAIDVAEIAKKLRVKNIVEGSVRKMGDRLRVNAQLIDGANGRHIWAERYDGNMSEIFEFQDDIRKQIVSALQISLTPTDRSLSERKPTNSVEAYDLFLKGRAYIHLYTPESFIEATKHLETAIGIDPHFAEAYGFLALCHYYGWVYCLPNFDDNLDRANELAERGVALDGTSAIALTRLGWIQSFMRRYEQAIANLEKALALDPESAEVHATFGNVLNYWGDPNRGLVMIKAALRLDPFAPPLWEYYAGISHYLLKHYDEAIVRQTRAIERTPKLLYAYLYIACSYVEMGRLDDARDATKTLLEIAPDFTLEQVARNVPWRLDKDRDRLLGSLRKAGMP